MQLQLLFDERGRHADSPFDRALAVARTAATPTRPPRSSSRGSAGRAPRRSSRGTSTTPAPRLLVSLLPRPLPDGDPWNEYVLTMLLLRAGALDEAARYGAASYAREPSPMLAVTIARAAAALGDEDTAVAWLRAATDLGTLLLQRRRGDRPGPRAGRRPPPP